MKIQKYFKVILTTIAITSIMVMLSAGESSAALQANQNTQYTKKDVYTSWIQNFRQMETANAAMGLNETLKTDLTPSSSSNNIDVHMMRATEYGAIAILSASGYGNPSNAQEITSTTGNNTGIILNTGNWEQVAAGIISSSNKFFPGINNIYYDTYTTDENSAKIGDALGTASATNPGAAGWHKAPQSSFPNSINVYLKRGYKGIFSFNNNSNSISSAYAACSRGVAVCGEGL